MTPAAITQPIQAPAAAAGPGPAARVAQEFEAVLLEAVLQQMIRAGAAPGGGERGLAGDVFGGWWVRELAAAVARAGGIGLAGALEQQLIRRYGR